MIGDRGAGIKERILKTFSPAAAAPGDLASRTRSTYNRPLLCAGHAANAFNARMRMAAAVGASAPAACAGP